VRHWFALALVSGCVIADPINQRPSLDIEREGGGDVFRGDEVRMHGIANDPENQLVFFQWRAYACTDATADSSGARPGCDAQPFYTEILQDARLVVPAQRADATDSVQQVLVLLEGQDDYGATAKPIQQLVISISDHGPDLAMRKDSRYGYVVDTAMNVYAKVGDADDGAQAVTLEWKVYSPMNQPNFTLVDADPPVPQDPLDPKHLQVGKTFTPQGPGDYEIQVTARDPLQQACADQGGTDCTSTVESVMVTVVPDHAPCLTQLAPLVVAAPNALPLSDPTLFQVTVVQDDLDPFPGVPSDLVLGTPKFHWSILPPGASTRTSSCASRSRIAS
jgi:hypothetical protein